MKEKCRSTHVSSSVALLANDIDRKSYAIDALTLFAIALVLYSSFASCSFNEGDSFNFAKALMKVDLYTERPHAPGYPVYVFLGRIIFMLTRSQLIALVWLSVVSGALTLIPLYFLTRAMYNRESAALTCVALMVVPGFWLSNEKATTDALSAFLVVLGVTLLYFGMRGSRTATLVSWVVYALSIGARPTHLAFVPLWVYGTLRRRNFKELLACVGAFFVAVSLWLVPVIWVTGWERFLSATRHMYTGTASTDFVLARPLGLDPLERLISAVAGILTFGMGAMLPHLFGFGFPFASNSIPTFYILHDTLLVGIVLCFLVNFKKIVQKIFTLLWIIPHFAFVYMFGSPIHYRYYLTIYPALMLLAVPSVTSLKAFRCHPTLKIKWHRPIHLMVVLLIIVTFTAHTMPLAEKLHTEPSPITQLARYVEQNYSSKETTILVFHEYSAFEICAPQFEYYHCRRQLTESLEQLKTISNGNRTLLITSTAYEYLLRHHLVLQLEAKKIVEFYLDPRAEIEDHRVSIYLIHAARVL